MSRLIRLSWGLALAILVGMPASAQAKSVKAWHIKQSHKMYGRNIEIYLAPKKFKWCSKDSSISILMKAPDWQVNVYNARTGNLYKCKAEQFRSPAIVTARLFDGIEWAKLPLKKVDQVKISGVLVDHFRSGKTHENLKQTDYWVTNNLAINKQVILLMAKLYDGPVGKGIPVKHLYLRPWAKTPTTGIKTMSMRRALVPVSVFSMPKNLKLKKSENDVFADKRHEKGLEWMLR